MIDVNNPYAHFNDNSSNQEYNIHTIIKDIFNTANLPIYKEEIILAKAIIHLRKIMPSTYKRSAIVKVLMGKAKQYTKDEYYGYGNTNINWYKTKLGDYKLIDLLVDYIIYPLYEESDEIFGDERDEYFGSDLKKCDQLKMAMIERQIDKLIPQYKNNPSLVSSEYNPFFSKLGYLDIFEKKEYFQQFEAAICKFIQQTYQEDNVITNIVKMIQSYDKTVIGKTNTNKYLTFKHASTKKTLNSIKFIFHTALFVYDTEDKKFSHYKAEVEIFENQPMTVSFTLVKDKNAGFDIQHPLVPIKLNNSNIPNVTFLGQAFGFTLDESVSFAHFYSDYTHGFDDFHLNVKFPEYSEDILTNIKNYQSIIYINII